MATAPLSTLGKPTVELVGSDSNGLISFLNAGTTAVSASSKTNFSILKIYIYILAIETHQRLSASPGSCTRQHLLRALLSKLCQVKKFL